MSIENLLESFISPSLTISPSSPTTQSSPLPPPPRPHPPTSNAPSTTINKSLGSIDILIFSKDRAFQLNSLLESYKSATSSSPSSQFQSGIFITVICRTSNPNAIESYAKLARLHSDVDFIYECHFKPDFGVLLKQFIFKREESGENENIVLFHVDDAIYHTPHPPDLLDLKGYAQLLLTDPSLLTVHLKLHPAITYSHSSSKACMHPPLNYVNCNVYTWQYESVECVGEWKYPFDVCGSMYRLDTIKDILNVIDGDDDDDDEDAVYKNGYENPNSFEVNGNIAITQLMNDRPKVFGANRMLMTKGGCCARQVLSVVTVNRVQGVYSAPVYITSDSSSNEGENLEYLEQCFRRGLTLDIAAYSRTVHNSVHIGGVYLKPCTALTRIPSSSSSSEPQQNSNSNSVKPTNSSSRSSRSFSILLPIKSGPAKYAKEAGQSILDQLTLNPSSSLSNSKGKRSESGVVINSFGDVQIVIVDDGCKDGSVTAITALFLQSNLFAQTQPQTLSNLTHTYTYTYIVIKGESRGLAAALNLGLGACRHDIVFRMDCDDVIVNDRFNVQLDVMTNDTDLAVLGSAVLIFTDDDDYDDGDDDEKNVNLNDYGSTSTRSRTTGVNNNKIIRTVIHPTDPAVVAYALCFSCVVCHPSVCFRKSRLLEVGGYFECFSDGDGGGGVNCDADDNDDNCCYNDDARYVEDYEMWLRLCQNYGRAIKSVGEVGLMYRKHLANTSALHREKQERNSSMCACNYVKGLIFNSTTTSTSAGINRIDNVDVDGDDDGGYDVLTTLSILRRPRACNSVDLKNAVNLLLLIELSFSTKASVTRREIQIIENDVNERLLQLYSLNDNEECACTCSRSCSGSCSGRWVYDVWKGRSSEGKKKVRLLNEFRKFMVKDGGEEEEDFDDVC